MKIRSKTIPARIDDRCATRWPILLVHGVGFKQAEKHRFWGRIPERLRAHGAQVFISNQDGWGSFESNALQLKDIMLRILDEQQVDKLNILAHSKGGIDVRLLATFPELKDRIASITTISTPHNGSKILNWVPHTPDLLKRLASTVIDTLLILFGDDNPSFVYVCQDLSAASMQEFNSLYPKPETIFLQSYSVVQKRIRTDLIFSPTMLLIRLAEGENDGLVARDSAAFGDYRGEVNENGSWGLSHTDIINRKLLPIPQRSINRDGFDVLAWWVERVAELKSLGY